MKDERSALAKITGVIGGVAGRVIIAALLLLLTFEGLRICFDFGHDIFYQQPMEADPGTDHVVTLEDGATMQSTAEKLKDEGLIRNELAFVIQGELYQINLYPGDYTLNTSMTTKEILTALNTDPEEYAAQVKESEAEREAAAEAGKKHPGVSVDDEGWPVECVYEYDIRSLLSDALDSEKLFPHSASGKAGIRINVPPREILDCPCL